MDNTLLVNLSRQMALSRELDVVANNVANMNTTGFKGDSMLFNEYLMLDKSNGQGAGPKTLSTVVDRSTITNFSAGPIETTGAELDVAIQGNGFFVVQTPQGERYTRAGSFTLNAQGELVTQTGDGKVQGTGGALAFSQQDGKISIGSDGTIFTDQGQHGKLRLVTLKPGDLKKEGEQFFSSKTHPVDDTTSLVLQGAIEKSNVKPVTEISRLIEINRAYSTISQIIDRAQSLRETAIDRLAQAA